MLAEFYKLWFRFWWAQNVGGANPVTYIRHMLYHFDIALARHAPMSAREHLQTIEADSSGDALDLIAKQAMTGQQGLETVWIRVVETWNADGTPAKVRKVEVTIRPVAMDN